MNKKEIVYGICVITLAIQLTSVITNEWGIQKSEGGLVTQNMGLWKLHTVEKGGFTNDIHLPPNNDDKFPKNSLYACRAFSIIGILCVFSALVLMYKYPSKMLMHYWLLLAGGIASILSMIIYAIEMLKFDGNKFDTGYSFHLQWIAGVIAVFTAIYHGSK
jgi:hypothetical protein